MNKKLKFKPVITRIKLDPEQAVLACSCWNRGRRLGTSGTRRNTCVCLINQKTTVSYSRTSSRDSRS